MEETTEYGLKRNGSSNGAQKRSGSVTEVENPAKRPKAPQYNFIRYCYRHNPDIQSSPTHQQCKRQELERLKVWESKLEGLISDDEKQRVMQIVSGFESANDKLRKLILEGMLLRSCFPQLSFISSQIQKLIRIDFVSVLPEEIAIKILQYLDCQSLCAATAVCRRWKELADQDTVWYHMCEQHIDRKCPRCGWGLPLLHMKRARYIKPAQEENQKSVVPAASRMRPWKVIYRERFKVESNWRKGIYKLQEFKGHMDGVLSLQFTHSLLFTGSYDSTVAIWDLVSGKLIRRLTGHTDGVKALRFEDQKLITGSLDKTIRVWNYVTGACVSTYRGHQDSVLSVDSYKKIIVSGSADKTVKVWHVESRTCYTLRGHTEWVNSVKLHPKSFTCFSCSDDTTIRMWDIKTNNCIRVFRGHVAQVQKVLPITYVGEDLVQDTLDSTTVHEFSNYEDPSVNCSNWDSSLPYPTHLLSCSLDNTIKLWDVRSGKCIRTQFGHVEGIWDIAADNFRIVSGSHDRSCKVWDLQSGKCMHTFTGNQAPVVCVGIGDSEFVCGDELGSVKMYNFGSGLE
ncbi:HCL148Wp [Eremothecium sinecaudum]|uniref:HCL148Wp n=1 Tax=Eremothecium sinecaudum TaxID=45286 RepID=A0A0X8HRC2_9SACH|nr:HCL148Wp [Eremothecium sinecaudum]AMD20003.1 HCL148Wp [Eremothecium sinecaudum]